MILQKLKCITLTEMKCFTGEYRLKLTTILDIQYKIHHHNRYVLVDKIGVGQYQKKRTGHRLSTKQVVCTMYHKQ